MELWQLLLVIFTGVIALSNLVLLVGLAYLAVALTGTVNRSVSPAISEVTHTVRTVNDLVVRVERSAESMLQIGEDTARRVSGSVLAATSLVEHGIAQPFIALASLASGISEALYTLRRSA